MILVVDNYDSFTFNLVQALRTLGAEVEVRRNDAIDEGGVDRLAPDAVVLSPGPGRPEDTGITPRLIRHLSGRVPLLGVCLGHQAIGLVHGARVVRAPPVHGKATEAHHDSSGLFAGLPNPMPVGRYHSLVVERASLPSCLRVTATSADGLVMALEHRTAPLWGVQFHPESILTPDGPALLARFVRSSGAHRTAYSTV